MFQLFLIFIRPLALDTQLFHILGYLIYAAIF